MPDQVGVMGGAGDQVKDHVRILEVIGKVRQRPDHQLLIGGGWNDVELHAKTQPHVQGKLFTKHV